MGRKISRSLSENDTDASSSSGALSPDQSTVCYCHPALQRWQMNPQTNSRNTESGSNRLMISIAENANTSAAAVVANFRLLRRCA